MNYNEVVSSLRSLAREELRLKAVNAVRQNLMEVQSRADAVAKAGEEFSQSVAKKLAILNFKLAKLDDNDPEKADKEAALNEDIKSLTEFAERKTKETAEVSETLAKELAEVNGKITEIQDGKVKVCKEELEAVANRLISEVTVELAKEVAATVQHTA